MYRNLLSISLACSIALSQPLTAIGADSSVESAQNGSVPPADPSTALNGDPGVVFTRLDDGSTSVGPRPYIAPQLRSNSLFFSGDSRVIKVGDVYAKDKTIEDLNKLLLGAENSEVEITLVEGDRQIIKKLKRYKKTELKERPEFWGSLLNLSDTFTGWHGTNEGFAGLGQMHHSAGNNFVAAPYFIGAVKPEKFFISSFFDDYTTGLPDAMNFFARTGLFENFDVTVKACQKLLAASSRSEAENEVLAKCADILEKQSFTGSIAGNLRKITAIDTKFIHS